ncbi:MAG: topoisomerase [Actinomycetota bacterium]|nr:topoisomerase [Actinomycetota bacterium]
MAKALVIVESPAKAKTIAGILGRDFIVESSIGHVRDLPATATEIPAAYRGEPWARLGVDVDNDFKPLYVVPGKKKQQVSKLKGLMKGATELFLATDEDREGESIAWHLTEVLAPRIPVKRMVFHEITKEAVRTAAKNPRELDRRLVDAQEARRILDRLYGYEVSPVLWRKVLPKLSAGRVQSVATRIIVERERERMRFRAAEYWDIEGDFQPEGAGQDAFGAVLLAVDDRRVATGKDFDPQGNLRGETLVLDESRATALAEGLRDAPFAVKSVEQKPYRRSPSPPFITSTLQQEAGRKLRFSSQRTMQVAQRLYENGFITYMRTDSTTLSGAAIAAARAQIKDLYGPDYVPSSPRQYKRKVKNAQEAHEAIRPAGDHFRTPDDLSSQLVGDEMRLYDLIWKRTVASQMADAVGRSVQVRLEGRASSGETAEFGTSGTVITFPGFLRAYVEGADDPEAELADRETHLPDLREGQALRATAMEPKGHSTQPPPRFTEASLVKRLEELGVGRPSTYASIMGTIQDRGYVWKKGSALVPSYIAFSVVGLLEQHFSKLVDYDFTAKMEDDLDMIAAGESEASPWLRKFYFGNGQPGLKVMVSEHLDEIDAREVNSIPVGKDADGVEIIVRVGRYGPYLQRGDDRASVPEDLAPDELTIEKAEELLNAPSHDRVLGPDPETGLEVWAKAGRYGPYVQLGEMEEGSKEKPKTASLFKNMELPTVTLEDALRLLTLPRTVGVADDGEEILALNGRYGPYIKKGSDTRSLGAEGDIFGVSMEDALALLAQPKQRGRGAAAAPLREMGEDPVTKAPIVVKNGRFGPYVTDGEYNASIPRDLTIESLTLERAAEMLAEKRAAGPPKKKKSTRRKSSAKKTTKKTTKKKTSKARAPKPPTTS